MKIVYFLVFLFLSAQFTIDQGQSLYLGNQDGIYFGKASITEAVVTVKPKGTFFEVSLYMTISADNTTADPSDSLELTFNFWLGPYTGLTDMWLWKDENILKAEILDVVNPSNGYEWHHLSDIIPLRTTVTGIWTFQTFIYPILKGEPGKLKLTFMQPATIEDNIWSFPLPFHILDLAGNRVPVTRIIYYPSDEFENPRIESVPDVVFTPHYNPEAGNYYMAEYPKKYGFGRREFLIDKTDKDTDYSSIWGKESEGLFQLNLPAEKIYSEDEGRKFLIMLHLDHYSSSMYYDITEAALLSALRKNMKIYNNSFDQFKLVYVNDEMRYYSQEWLPCNDLNIRGAIDFIIENDLAHNLLPIEECLKNAHALLKEEAPDSEILLLSNSFFFGNCVEVDNYISNNPQFANSDIKINIFDFCEDMTYYDCGNQKFLNNRYFYEKLTQLTNGIIMPERAFIVHLSSLDSMIPKIFESMRKQISMTDLSILNSSGETTENHLSFDRNGISVIGKYTGDSNFILNLNYTVDGELKDYGTEINISSLADSTLYTYWATQENSKYYYDESRQNHLLSLSLRTNMLSKYTYYICLDPAYGGQICTNCFDETTLPVEELITDTLLVEEFTVNAFPNPFNPSTNISINFNPGADKSNLEFGIYNILGQLVKKFEPESLLQRSQFNFKWNGEDNLGRKVASGHYFFVASTMERVKTLKLILLK